MWKNTPNIDQEHCEGMGMQAVSLPWAGEAFMAYMV